MKDKLKQLLFESINSSITVEKVGLFFSGGVDSVTLASAMQYVGKKFECYFAGVFDLGSRAKEPFHSSECIEKASAFSMPRKAFALQGEMNFAYCTPAGKYQPVRASETLGVLTPSSLESTLAEPNDYAFAKKVSQQIGIKLNVAKINLQEVEDELCKIISIIDTQNPVSIGVALTIYFAAKEMQRNGVKQAVSGLGPDELFAGYAEFNKSKNINDDCRKRYENALKTDLVFTQKICTYFGIELKAPYMNEKFAANAIKIPAKEKIGLINGKKVNKKILREMALDFGVSEEIALRPKKAAQYGSNFDKAIEKLAKKKGFKLKSKYLESIALLHKKLPNEKTTFDFQKAITKNENINQPKKSAPFKAGLRISFVGGIGTASAVAEAPPFRAGAFTFPIAALISTGKDSLYAMHLLQKQGYVVKCLITIESKNKDSFMFHTPLVKLANLQAKALKIPLITIKTAGKKEEELKDLKKIILTAKNKFMISGISSGALYSIYQRERIDKICSELKIKPLAPLWHKNQINYLKEIVSAGFEVIIVKIACFGLNDAWLGRKIDVNAINELALLEKKYKINPAGEGGEYESLVLDAPFFKKKILIEFSKKMQNEFTGEIIIQKAKLIEK